MRVGEYTQCTGCGCKERLGRIKHSYKCPNEEYRKLTPNQESESYYRELLEEYNMYSDAVYRDIQGKFRETIKPVKKEPNGSTEAIEQVRKELREAIGAGDEVTRKEGIRLEEGVFNEEYGIRT